MYVATSIRHTRDPSSRSSSDGEGENEKLLATNTENVQDLQ